MQQVITCNKCSKQFRINFAPDEMVLKCPYCKNIISDSSASENMLSIPFGQKKLSLSIMSIASIGIVFIAACIAIGYAMGYSTKSRSDSDAYQEMRTRIESLETERNQLAKLNESISVENNSLRVQIDTLKINETNQSAKQKPRVNENNESKLPKQQSPLIGTWVGTYFEMGGYEQTADKEKGKVWKWQFDEKDAVYGAPGGDSARVPWRVDTSVTPFRIDFGRWGSDPFEPVLVGIWRIQDNQLTICMSADPQLRPSLFSSKHEKDVFLLFKMLKEK